MPRPALVQPLTTMIAGLVLLSTQSGCPHVVAALRGPQEWGHIDTTCHLKRVDRAGDAGSGSKSSVVKPDAVLSLNAEYESDDPKYKTMSASFLVLGEQEAALRAHIEASPTLACTVDYPEGGGPFPTNTRVKVPAWDTQARDSMCVSDLNACAKSCQDGSATDCRRMAISRTGKGDESTTYYARAVELSRTGCSAKKPEDCWVLGVLTQNHNGIPQDDKAMVAAWTQACDASWGPACTELARLSEGGFGGVTKDPAAARELYRRSCAAHSQQGCQDLTRVMRSAP